MKMGMTGERIRQMVHEANDPTISPARQVESIFTFLCQTEPDVLDYEAMLSATAYTMVDFVKCGGRIAFIDREAK